MKFSGFDREALDELRRLPRLDAAGYAARRALLHGGLIEPAHALLGEVVALLDARLTTSARDLRFQASQVARRRIDRERRRAAVRSGWQGLQGVAVRAQPDRRRWLSLLREGIEFVGVVRSVG